MLRLARTLMWSIRTQQWDQFHQQPNLDHLGSQSRIKGEVEQSMESQAQQVLVVTGDQPRFRVRGKRFGVRDKRFGVEPAELPQCLCGSGTSRFD